MRRGRSAREPAIDSTRNAQPRPVLILHTHDAGTREDMMDHYTDYQGYVEIEFKRLEQRFSSSTLDRHEKRILKALYATRCRLTPIDSAERGTA